MDIKKDSVFNIIDSYIEQEVNRKNKNEIQDFVDNYIRLEYALPTLSFILNLTPQGIKKYLEETGYIKFTNDRYFPIRRSKMINDRLYIDKRLLFGLIKLNVFIEIVECGKLQDSFTTYQNNKNEYILQAYNMSTVEEKRDGAKFEKARELLKINNI